MLDNQAVTFSYAATNFTDFQLKPIPSTNQCMTKEDIVEYLDVDSVPLSSYANNQLVPLNKIRTFGMLPEYLEFAVSMAYPQSYPPGGNPLDGINEPYKKIVELKSPVQQVADNVSTYYPLSSSYFAFFNKVRERVRAFSGTSNLQIKVTFAEYGNVLLNSQQLGQLIRIPLLNNSDRDSEMWKAAMVDWTYFGDEGEVLKIGIDRLFYPLTLGVLARKYNGREIGFFSIKVMPHDYFN